MNRTIREELEQYEQDYLSPYASKSAETRGRDREEPACDIRPAYQRDPNRVYGFSFAGQEIRFSVDGGVLTVRAVATGE